MSLAVTESSNHHLCSLFLLCGWVVLSLDLEVVVKDVSGSGMLLGDRASAYTEVKIGWKGSHQDHSV